MAEASCPEDAAAVLEVPSQLAGMQIRSEYQPLTLRLEREVISHQKNHPLKCGDWEKDMICSQEGKYSQ